jgi:hypothetical protein
LVNRAEDAISLMSLIVEQLSMSQTWRWHSVAVASLAADGGPCGHDQVRYARTDPVPAKTAVSQQQHL